MKVLALLLPLLLSLHLSNSQAAEKEKEEDVEEVKSPEPHLFLGEDDKCYKNERLWLAHCNEGGNRCFANSVAYKHPGLKDNTELCNRFQLIWVHNCDEKVKALNGEDFMQTCYQAERFGALAVSQILHGKYSCTPEDLTGWRNLRTSKAHCNPTTVQKRVKAMRA